MPQLIKGYNFQTDKLTSLASGPMEVKQNGFPPQVAGEMSLMMNEMPLD